jgi:hypothetical protein
MRISGIKTLAAVLATATALVAAPASAQAASPERLADVYYRADVVLFKDAGYQGQSIRAGVDVSTLQDGGGQDLDNQVSSILNYGTGYDICFYVNYGFKGRYLRVLENRGLADLANHGEFNDNISSFRAKRPGQAC